MMLNSSNAIVERKSLVIAYHVLHSRHSASNDRFVLLATKYRSFIWCLFHPIADKSRGEFERVDE